jgi:glucosylceramidase
VKALDMEAGPRWNEKQGYFGPVLIDAKKGEAYKQPTFYTIGHFSKFIPPNSVRIGHKVDKKVDGLSVLTVRRPDNATVVVALNANNNEIELNINDSKTYLTHKISPHSVQSYIWW